jgi:hypothetical protein
MTTTKVEFTIHTDGPVSRDEIAHAIWQLFQTRSFPYNKPKLITTTRENGRNPEYYSLAEVEGEPIGVPSLC